MSRALRAPPPPLSPFKVSVVRPGQAASGLTTCLKGVVLVAVGACLLEVQRFWQVSMVPYTMLGEGQALLNVVTSHMDLFCFCCSKQGVKTRIRAVGCGCPLQLQTELHIERTRSSWLA